MERTMSRLVEYTAGLALDPSIIYQTLAGTGKLVAEATEGAAISLEHIKNIPDITLTNTSLTSDQKCSFFDLLRQYASLFARDELDVGRTQLTEHIIDTAEHAPIRQAPYRVPYKQREAINEEIGKMLQKGEADPFCSKYLNYLQMNNLPLDATEAQNILLSKDQFLVYKDKFYVWTQKWEEWPINVRQLFPIHQYGEPTSFGPFLATIQICRMDGDIIIFDLLKMHAIPECLINLLINTTDFIAFDGNCDWNAMINTDKRLTLFHAGADPKAIWETFRHSKTINIQNPSIKSFSPATTSSASTEKSARLKLTNEISERIACTIDDFTHRFTKKKGNIVWDDELQHYADLCGSHLNTEYESYLHKIEIDYACHWMTYRMYVRMLTAFEDRIRNGS
uniref:Uncharacterized protein n=1 Tax=Romanomermis culicivorax TaxID=13658 RepID=A0A915JS42_ROMCU